MATKTRPLEELEAAILAGEKVSEQEFGAAQGAAASRQRIADLNAKRVRNEQRAKVQEEWHANMLAKRQTFESLVEGEAKLQELWLNVSKAIDAWMDAATSRNETLNELNGYFFDQEKRIAETDGIEKPFNFSAEQTNGTCLVGRQSLSPINISWEIDRVVGLTVGKYLPNNALYLGHGGGEAAKEAGIR